MSYGEIWDKLSKIDCSKRIEKKMGLSYLPWAWAWGTLMEHYPQATYTLAKAEPEQDGTLEVICTVKIDDCCRHMWLPVMDHKNKAIVNPDAREISDAKMRCLVKCLAMFGLGHSLYTGHDAPQESSEDPFSAAVVKNIDAITCIKSGLIESADTDSGFLDFESAAEAWFTLDQEAMTALWRAPTKGGIFSTRERAIMKTSEFRQAYFGEDK